MRVPVTQPRDSVQAAPPMSGKTLYRQPICSRHMASDYEQLLKRAKAALPKALSSGERFKVPEADIVVEGKTTILRNFEDICATIRRDPNQVLTYLLRELGTAGGEGGRAGGAQGEGRRD